MKTLLQIFDALKKYENNMSEKEHDPLAIDLVWQAGELIASAIKAEENFCFSEWQQDQKDMINENEWEQKRDADA